MPSTGYLEIYNIPGMSPKGLRGVVDWLHRLADHMQRHSADYVDTIFTAKYEYQKDTYKAEKKRARQWGDYTEGNTWGGYGKDKKKVDKKPSVPKAKRKKPKKKPKKRRAY
jgi:hypothetical protein